MKSVLAAIITYYPNNEELRENIMSIIDNVDFIIVWENSDVNDIWKFRPVSSPKVEYVSEGENRGIAPALKQILDYATENNYDYLLVMDQDSYWEDFAAYKNAVLSDNGRNALYGALREINSPKANQTYNGDIFLPTVNLINSSLMAKVSLLNELGGFCDKLFIDGVDEELVCRAIENNIPCFLVKAGTFHHKLGYPVKKIVCGKILSFSDYSEFRIYDRYKSLFMILIRYSNVKVVCSRLKHDWIKVYPIRVILAGENRISKVWAMIRGCISGLFTRI